MARVFIALVAACAAAADSTSQRELSVNVTAAVLAATGLVGADNCDYTGQTLIYPGGTAGVIPAGQAISIPCSGRTKPFSRSATVYFKSNNYVKITLASGACSTTVVPSSGTDGTSPQSTLTQTSVSVLNKDSSSTNYETSCLYVSCNNILQNCTGVKLVAAFYVPQPTSNAPCTVADAGLAALPPGDVQSWSCSFTNLPSAYKQSITISNPNTFALTASVTDGTDCAAGTSGKSFRSYSQTDSTKSTISFSNVPCATSPCCTIIECKSSNGDPCMGLRVTTSYGSTTTAAGLAAGVIAAIIIGVIVVAVSAGCAAKRYRSQQLTIMGGNVVSSGGSGGSTTVVVTNPTMAYGASAAISDAYGSKVAYPTPQYGPTPTAYAMPQQQPYGAQPPAFPQPQFGSQPAYPYPPQPQYR